MSSPPTASFRAVVRGRVQGVGFRDYVRSYARANGISGYVGNSRDGRSVEILAEGPEEQLKSLLRRLFEGPRMSRVDGVEVEWGDFTGEHATFEIRH